jgi:hypothetical protein
LKEILPSKQNFQCGERFLLFQIGHFRKVEETDVSLKRKRTVFEAGEPSTLFPCET